VVLFSEHEKKQEVTPDGTVSSGSAEGTECREDSGEVAADVLENNERGEWDLGKDKSTDNTEMEKKKDKAEEKVSAKEETPDSLKKKLVQAETDIEKKDQEIADLKDLLLRRQADFENYKKRMAKTLDDFKKLAIKDFALDVIVINDDLLRAIEASSTVKNGESPEQCHNSFVDGVSMISRMIEEMLKKYSILEIDSLNQSFDPQCNEAVEVVMSSEVKEDTITKIYQKGFKLDDLVVRSAKVQVARPVSPGENSGTDDGNDSGSGGREAQEIVN
jgi:molecular chaperone GrpE